MPGLSKVCMARLFTRQCATICHKDGKHGREPQPDGVRKEYGQQEKDRGAENIRDHGGLLVERPGVWHFALVKTDAHHSRLALACHIPRIDAAACPQNSAAACPQGAQTPPEEQAAHNNAMKNEAADIVVPISEKVS